jgi:hypothetical protein
MSSTFITCPRRPPESDTHQNITRKPLKKAARRMLSQKPSLQCSMPSTASTEPSPGRPLHVQILTLDLAEWLKSSYYGCNSVYYNQDLSCLTIFCTQNNPGSYSCIWGMELGKNRTKRGFSVKNGGKWIVPKELAYAQGSGPRISRTDWGNLHHAKRITSATSCITSNR